PDGGTIVFDRTAPAPNSNNSAQVWAMNADGSNPRQLTSLSAFNAWPRVSPDGTRIVFQHGETSDGPFDLAVANADGPNAQARGLNVVDNEFPAWQPAQWAPPAPPTGVTATAGNSS